MQGQRHLTTARILVFVLIAVLACQAQKAPAPPSAVPPEASGPPAKAPRIGLAPDFTLASVSGETIRLSDFRGRVVLLNFWATWCGPCKIAMPWFAELQNEFGPRGLQVLAIALDEDATKVEIGEAGDQVPANYPILVGNEKVADLYGGIPGMPVSFLIGRDGRLIETITGITSKGAFEKSVRKALDSDPAIPKHKGSAENSPPQNMQWKPSEVPL